MNCERVRQLLLPALMGEADDAEHHALEVHRLECAACALEWEELRSLHALLAQRPRAEAQPGQLLAWRERLGERIDEEPGLAGATGGALIPRALRRWWGRVGLPLALPRVQVLPGMAVGLIFAGFLGGWAMRGRTVHSGSGVNAASLDGNGGDEPLRVNAVNHDAQNGQVQIDYDTVARRSLEGNPTDPRVRQLLIYAVQNPPNSGVRLDSIEALRATTARAGQPNQSVVSSQDDSEVRRTLLWAFSHDSNPGVRLKALDALTPEVAQHAGVRQALLQAVLNDANPGVRTAAINALGQAHRADVDQLLQQAADRSPDVYVRLRIAAVLRQMEEAMPPDMPSSAPDGDN